MRNLYLMGISKDFPRLSDESLIAFFQDCQFLRDTGFINEVDYKGVEGIMIEELLHRKFPSQIITEIIEKGKEVLI